jgi:DNA-binding GntR family transcriptional regulator
MLGQFDPSTTAKRVPPKAAHRERATNLAKIERTPGVSERVFRQLRDAVVSGELAPGAPVIIEQLAQSLGVSRTPIREALPALQQLGLIVEAGNGSFRVAPLSASYAGEVYAIRTALETLLVEAVAPLLTEDDLRALRTAASKVGTAGSEHEAGPPSGFDVEFHEILVELCPLPFLKVLLDTVKVHRARLLDLEHSDASGYRHESIQEHLAIVAALEHRDAAGARRLMQQHLDRVGAAIAHLAASRSDS